MCNRNPRHTIFASTLSFRQPGSVAEWHITVQFLQFFVVILMFGIPISAEVTTERIISFRGLICKVRETGKYGKGIFATEDVPAGTTVWQYVWGDPFIGIVPFPNRNFHFALPSLFSAVEQRGDQSILPWPRKEGVVHALLLPSWFVSSIIVFPFFRILFQMMILFAALRLRTTCAQISRTSGTTGSTFYSWIRLIVSCDGNTWYDGANRIVANRDIKAGEQLTYDYALTETTFAHFEVENSSWLSLLIYWRIGSLHVWWRQLPRNAPSNRLSHPPSPVLLFVAFSLRLFISLISQREI